MVWVGVRGGGGSSLGSDLREISLRKLFEHLKSEAVQKQIDGFVEVGLMCMCAPRGKPIACSSS